MYIYTDTYYTNVLIIGGGAPKKKKDDPILEKVIAIIKTSAEGLSNPYDTDDVTKENLCEYMRLK